VKHDDKDKYYDRNRYERRPHEEGITREQGAEPSCYDGLNQHKATCGARAVGHSGDDEQPKERPAITGIPQSAVNQATNDVVNKNRDD